MSNHTAPELVRRMVAQGLVRLPRAGEEHAHASPGKTGRAYGTIWDRIRAVARSRPEFTRLDFPGLDPISVSRALKQLAAAGQLRLVRPGTLGRTGRPAIYARMK